MQASTCLTLRDLEPDMLKDAAAIVIDALRMTSAAVTAIAHGCAGMRPVSGIDEARQIAAHSPGTLLCGERLGKPLPGFDLGNSPLEYTRQRVYGRKLVSTTTNGTRALCAAQPASLVVIGSFLNARAAAARVRDAERLVMLCAGNSDRLSLEDVLAAGNILAHLQNMGVELDTDDASETALCLYEQGQENLPGMLWRSAHCRFLRQLGKEASADVDYCLQQDVFDIAPVLRGDWIVANGF